MVSGANRCTNNGIFRRGEDREAHLEEWRQLSASPLRECFPSRVRTPGIIVGEIVTAFQRGEVDHLALRDAGAFDTSYQPRGGGTDVYFEPLSVSPQTPDVTTASTSVSGSRPFGCDEVCLKQCAHAVRTMGGVVTVHRGDEVIRVHI
jgi:hypothetical protein